MHELSIAMSLIDLAADALSKHGRGRVSVLHLKLGPLAGVDATALKSAFELAREGSPLQGAELDIEQVPIAIRCPTCGVERPVESPHMLCCATCGSTDGKVLHGDEMQLTSLEIEE